MKKSFTKEFREIISSFSSIFGLLEKSEKNNLILATILILFAGFLTNLPALIIGNMVDKMLNIKIISFDFAIPFIALMIIIILIKETLTIYRKYLTENVATKSEMKLTIKTIKSIFKSPIDGYISNSYIGTITGKISRSVLGGIKMIKLCFLDFFPALFVGLTAVIIAFVQKPIIASFMILIIPVGLFIVIKQISSQKGIRIDLLKNKEKIDGKISEILSGLETVRTHNTTDFEINKMQSLANKLRKIEIKHHIQMSLYDACKYFNESFFYIIVVSLSIYLSIKGIITKGDILVYSMLFTNILSPIRQIHRILDEAHESSIKVGDLKKLMNLKKDIVFETKNSKQIKDSGITIKNLSFFYGTKAIFSGFNLTIKAGEKIGFVGASGCGKSTLVKILLRLIHNYKGKISLFGKDLKKISIKDIGDYISYIPQKPYIFSGTIRENVIYGINRDLKEEDIIKTVKLVNIYEEIQKLGGLDGIIKEGGNNLSGGQKQRIAIARVFLKNPKLIIFDEATSALDNNNEHIIQKNIEKFFKNKTIITIAHRLHTLKNSDSIIVFENGKISQEGNYEKLKNENGLFKKYLSVGKTIT